MLPLPLTSTMMMTTTKMISHWVNYNETTPSNSCLDLIDSNFYFIVFFYFLLLNIPPATATATVIRQSRPQPTATVIRQARPQPTATVIRQARPQPTATVIRRLVVLKLLVRSSREDSPPLGECFRQGLLGATTERTPFRCCPSSVLVRGGIALVQR